MALVVQSGVIIPFPFVLFFSLRTVLDSLQTQQGTAFLVCLRSAGWYPVLNSPMQCRAQTALSRRKREAPITKLSKNWNREAQDPSRTKKKTDLECINVRWSTQYDDVLIDTSVLLINEARIRVMRIPHFPSKCRLETIAEEQEAEIDEGDILDDSTTVSSKSVATMVDNLTLEPTKEKEHTDFFLEGEFACNKELDDPEVISNAGNQVSAYSPVVVKLTTHSNINVGDATKKLMQS